MRRPREPAERHQDPSAANLFARALRAYGEGGGGPGHCFHQHVTYYLRVAALGIPPAAFYPGYVLTFDALRPGVEAREELFSRAADSFANYLRTTRSFERGGLVIEKVALASHEIPEAVAQAISSRSLLLTAVDTYHLPPFVEYQLVHGMTICACIGVSADRRWLDLWHWENTSPVDSDDLAAASADASGKFWRLSLRRNSNDTRDEHLWDVIGSHAPLAAALDARDDLARQIRSMFDHDLPLPEDKAERQILFHVPYRRVGRGEFRTGWLLRVASNRLVGAREATAELVEYLLSIRHDARLATLAALLGPSIQAWKTVNMLCIRHELGGHSAGVDLLTKHLQLALAADAAIGEFAAATAGPTTSALTTPLA